MRVHRFLVILERHYFHRSHLNNSCVVDQNIDRAKTIHDGLHHFLHFGVVSDVAFEREHIQVEYIDYLRLPYPQSNGQFTPYVTGLDLVANCGRAGVKNICSNTKPWRDFLNESE